MRVLHPVAANETFIASGIYRHFEREQPTPFTEAWTMHTVAGGARLIRIDRDGRLVDGLSHLAEVLISPEGRIERYNYHILHAAPEAKFKTLHTSYVFLDAYVQVTRKLDAGEPEYSEIALPQAGMVVRLLEYSFFWGRMLAQSREPTAAAQPVFVPFYKPGFAPGQVVLGGLPIIEEAAEETLTLGKRTFACQRYKTRGDRLIWVDAHDIPLQIVVMRGYAADRLYEYAHRQG